MTTDSWPTIPIVRPTARDAELEPGVVDVTDDTAIDEVLDYYHSALVPQLACGPEHSDPWPLRSWLQNPTPPRTVVTVRDGGVLVGVWVVKDGAIYAPCVEPAHAAGIFRALWDESTKHVDYLYGTSDNKLIMRFAKAALRADPLPTSPKLSADGTRVEWRRA